MNTGKKDFLQKVKKAIVKLSDAHSELCELWSNDSNHNVDLNEFLTPDYPFEPSFDDLNCEVAAWKDTSIEKIDAACNQTFTEFLKEFRESQKVYSTEESVKEIADEVSYGSDVLPKILFVYMDGFWIESDGKGQFSTIIENTEPSSTLLSDVEYELAKWVYPQF